MHTNAHIFKKLGFATTIQEYFVEHYTRIQNSLIIASKVPPDLVGGTKPKAFKILQLGVIGWEKRSPAQREFQKKFKVRKKYKKSAKGQFPKSAKKVYKMYELKIEQNQSAQKVHEK